MNARSCGRAIADDACQARSGCATLPKVDTAACPCRGGLACQGRRGVAKCCMRRSERNAGSVIRAGVKVMRWAVAVCTLGLVVLFALHWFNVLRVLGFGALGAEDRAWECLQAGDLAGAKSWLDKAISRAPEWYEPYELRGEVHERMGLDHKAIDDYTTAARLSAPYSANALALRGRVYEKLNHRAQFVGATVSRHRRRGRGCRVGRVKSETHRQGEMVGLRLRLDPPYAPGSDTSVHKSRALI